MFNFSDEAKYCLKKFWDLQLQIVFFLLFFLFVIFIYTSQPEEEILIMIAKYTTEVFYVRKTLGLEQTVIVKKFLVN